MQNYSYNGNKKGMTFALMESIDASYKDLGAVCDTIRYRKAQSALALLESIAGGRAVYYRTHNTGFGARHELGGRKGRYPMKAAKIVRRVLINAIANAKNSGYMPEELAVVHASANKKQILQRGPAKGVLYMGSGITGHTYGFAPARRSNLEYAKVEIGLASEESELGENAKRFIKIHEKEDSKLAAKVQQKPKHAKPKEKGQKKEAKAEEKKQEPKAQPKEQSKEQSKEQPKAIAGNDVKAKDNKVQPSNQEKAPDQAK